MDPSPLGSTGAISTAQLAQFRELDAKIVASHKQRGFAKPTRWSALPKKRLREVLTRAGQDWSISMNEGELLALLIDNKLLDHV